MARLGSLLLLFVGLLAAQRAHSKATECAGLTETDPKTKITYHCYPADAGMVGVCMSSSTYDRYGANRCCAGAWLFGAHLALEEHSYSPADGDAWQKTCDQTKCCASISAADCYQKELTELGKLPGSCPKEKKLEMEETAVAAGSGDKKTMVMLSLKPTGKDIGTPLCAAIDLPSQAEPDQPANLILRPCDLSDPAQAWFLDKETSAIQSNPHLPTGPFCLNDESPPDASVGAVHLINCLSEEEQKKFGQMQQWSWPTPGDEQGDAIQARAAVSGGQHACLFDPDGPEKENDSITADNTGKTCATWVLKLPDAVGEETLMV